MSAEAAKITLVHGTDNNPSTINGSGTNACDINLDFESEVTTGAVEYSVYANGIISEILITPGSPAPTAGWVVSINNEANNNVYATPSLSATAPYLEGGLKLVVAGTLKIYTKGMGSLKKATLTIKLVSASDDAVVSDTVPNVLDSAVDSDLSFSGQSISMLAGEAVIFPNVGYVKSDGKLWKANATTVATAPVFAMASASIAANASGLFILPGAIVRNDAWTWTIGGAIYLDTTSGLLSQTAPTGTDKVVQKIGMAISATQIFFNPSLDFITLV